jgi:hypothetical protein
LTSLELPDLQRSLHEQRRLLSRRGADCGMTSVSPLRIRQNSKTYAHPHYPFLSQVKCPCCQLGTRGFVSVGHLRTGTPCLQPNSLSVLSTPVSGSIDRERVSTVRTCGACGFGYFTQKPRVVVIHEYLVKCRMCPNVFNIEKSGGEMYQSVSALKSPL